VIWTSSSILLREFNINGYIVNVEPLHIGAGKEPPLGSLVDLAVLRIKYMGIDLPYIPGSSLKGVFRSTATTIVRSKGMKACSGLSKETCMELEDVVTERVKGELGEVIRSYLRENKSKEAMELFFKNACILCKIFGAPSYTGKVTFSDAYPIDENGKPFPFSFDIKTGIAIDRKTGAVYSGALYTLEYVKPGVSFKFSIHCTNLPNYALGLLATVMSMIQTGDVKIGGFKTRGLGGIRFEKLFIRARDLPKIESPILRSLEEGVDEEVDLSNLVTLKDGWLIAEGSSAWNVLRKLEEVWWRAGPKGRSNQTESKR